MRLLGLTRVEVIQDCVSERVENVVVALFVGRTVNPRDEVGDWNKGQLIAVFALLQMS